MKSYDCVAQNGTCYGEYVVIVIVNFALFLVALGVCLYMYMDAFVVNKSISHFYSAVVTETNL